MSDSKALRFMKYDCPLKGCDFLEHKLLWKPCGQDVSILTWSESYTDLWEGASGSGKETLCC